MPFLIAFTFGAIVGSFLNVCIARLPKEESIVYPPSRCPSCRHPLLWHDNVPVLSFIFLKGRCRNCQGRISIQYPAVEILTGVLFVLFYCQYGLSLKGTLYLALALALIVQAFIDWRYQIIPDSITLPGILAGLAASAFYPELHAKSVWSQGILWSIAGALLGGGILLAMGTAASLVLKKEAMGGGDVKLFAMIGAFLGWKAVLWTLFLASLAGTIIGLYFRLKRGQERLPFGPFIALGAVLYLFFGERFFAWYAGLIGF